MQRFVLSIMVTLCAMISFVPTSSWANSTSGPEPDISSNSILTLSCPGTISVTCDDPGIYTSFAEFIAQPMAAVNLQPGCNVTEFFYNGEVLFSQNGCSSLLFREYEILESCGNSFTCQQPIMLTDSQDPVLTNCPTAAVNISADQTGCTNGSYMAPTVTATDDCGPATVVDDAPMVFGPGTTTVTYTATDGCGNTSTCSYSVVLADNSAPTLTCPAGTNTECAITELPAATTVGEFVGLGGTVTDDCTADINNFTFISSTDVSDGGSCPETVNRTYVIADEAGNEGSCTQVITVEDITAPTFTLSAGVPVDCSNTQDTSMTGAPRSVMDNCMGPISVSYIDVDTVVGTCVGDWTIERQWIVEDACGNSSPLVQNVNVTDNTPPIAMCKDTTVYITTSLSTPITPSFFDDGSFDACSDVTLSINVMSFACNFIDNPTDVTMTVEDDCGNMASCIGVLTVLDTMSVVLSPPTPDTVSCLADVAPAFTDLPTYEFAGGSVTDACTFTGMISLVNADTTGICPRTIERTYEYDDTNGNIDSAVHIIIVNDTIAPMLIDCAADIDVTETQICDTLLTFGTALFSDNCGVVSVTNDYTDDDSEMAVFEGGVTTITFTATDECGNTATCSSTVTVAADPAITMPTVVGVNEIADIPTYADIDEFLAAGGMINGLCDFDSMTFMVDVVFPNGTTGCDVQAIQTVTITSQGGTDYSASTTFSFMDEEDPVFVTCSGPFPFGTILENCDYFFTIDTPVVTDNVGLDTLFRSPVDITQDTTTITWTAIDLCGNESTCEFDLVMLDLTSPDMGIEAATAMCDTSMIPIYTTVQEFLASPYNAFVEDCRLDSISFQFVGSQMIAGVLVRTYSIKDKMGNEATTNHIIEINDSTMPTITTCSPDVVADASATDCSAAVTVTPPVYNDNCPGTTFTITNDYNGTDDASDTYPVGTTTVIWTVTDNGNNSATCSFTVTVNDITAPVLNIAEPQMVECDITNVDIINSVAEFTAAGGTITEACGVETFSSEIVLEGGTCPIEYTRTFTAVDTAGNEGIFVQTILVDDTIDPVITCPDDITAYIQVGPGGPGLTCGREFLIPNATAVEACGIDSISNNFSNTAAAQINPAYGVGVHIITFTAVDLCGNTASCDMTITVIDTIPPTVTNPDTVAYECDADLPTQLTSLQGLEANGGSAFDECGLQDFAFDSEVQNGDTLIRTYIVTDVNGLTSEVQEVVIQDDTTPPSFDSPAIDVLTTTDPGDCFAGVQITTPSFSDNCPENTVTITNDFNGSNDASDDYPVGSTTVVWTIDDGEGNTATTSFVVTVNDEMNPTVSAPAAATFSCDTSEVAAITTLAELQAVGGDYDDNCGVEFFTTTITRTGGTDCTAEFERVFMVTDSSGNTAMDVQVLTRVEDEEPVITCPANVLVYSTAAECEMMLTIPTATATDDCGVDSVWNNYNTRVGDISDVFFPNSPLEISFYAADLCGNTDTCMMTVTVLDTIPPTVQNTNIQNRMCESMTIAQFATVQDIIDQGGIAEDNCGIDFVTFQSEVTVGDTIFRTYTIEDLYGNTSELIQTIVTDDTTPPNIDAPADITISCSDDPLDLALTGTVDTMAIMDNCMGMFTITFTDVTTAGSCANNSNIERTWTVEDTDGNSASDVQLIAVVDTVGPVFDKAPDAIDPIACDDDLPPVEVIAATDACGVAFVDVDTLIQVQPCSGGTVEYIYVASDACGNMTMDTAEVTVLPDTKVPTLLAINDVTIGTDASFCGVDTAGIAYPTFEDDCNGVTVTSLYPNTTFDIGNNKVSYRAVDACGNDTTVIQEVTVIDDDSPVLTCNDTITIGISLSANEIPLQSFYSFVDDNCGVDTILVRRMDASCGDPNTTDYRDFGLVCCEDVGNEVMFQLLVEDEAGNPNSCMVIVSVFDKLTPSVQIDIPDVTISCEFVLDTNDLSGFGKFVFEQADREDIIINDPTAPVTGVIGQDGLFYENCTASISESFTTDLTMCNTGTITRTWTVTDESGNVATADQVITITDFEPFNNTGMDIQWPADFEWDVCSTQAPPDTSISGAPILSGLDQCAMVSATFKDEFFSYPNSGCPFTKRTWKVIDWCQMDPNVPGSGEWIHVQSIHVINTDAPTFLTACTDTLICAPGSACGAQVSLSVAATDECTNDSQLTYSYTVDNLSDGSINLTGSGNSLSRYYNQGFHTITWTVSDNCGNTTSCSYVFEVRECKAPTPVCHASLAVGISSGADVELWASDVNNSSFDNCTPANQLGLSFSQDLNDDVVTFDCDDLGPNTVQLWVTDLAGNQTFCEAEIIVQDNEGSCTSLGGGNTGGTMRIAGAVLTAEQIGIAGATVELIGGEIAKSTTADENGEYLFEGLITEGQYEIAVSNETDYLEGVTTRDLVLIQRHVLGLELFDSPYKVIAADANNSETISATDILILRKLILGIVDELPDNSSWRFVAESNFSDMYVPWPFYEEKYIEEGSQEIDGDFVGVKIGDVDNTMDELLDPTFVNTRSNNELLVSIGDMDFDQDEVVYVNFNTEEDIQLNAFQSTITFDASKLKLIDIIPANLNLDFDEVNKSMANQGIVTIAYARNQTNDLADGDLLFQLQFEARGHGEVNDAIELNSRVTNAMAFDSDLEQYEITTMYRETESILLDVSQNMPNPFSERTTVEINLPEEMELSIKIFDRIGRIVYGDNRVFTAGSHQLILDDEIRNASGVLYLKVEGPEFSKGIKMIKIE